MSNVERVKFKKEAILYFSNCITDQKWLENVTSNLFKFKCF